MRQYLVKQRSALADKKDKDKNLKWRIDVLFKKLEEFYGTRELFLKASKVDVIDMMNSSVSSDRLLALRRILAQDPTISKVENEDKPDIEIDHLEEYLSDLYVRKNIEDEVQKRIQEKLDQKYNDYIQELKLQVIKEQMPATENAHTLKKLGKLEKMEASGLKQPVLELLRPSSLQDIIGQDKAVNALVSRLNTPYPQHILLYGPPGVGKTTCARIALEMVKGRPNSCFSSEAPFVEVDGTTLRWDPRESTNPLLGSVHDPIYQGAKKDLSENGVPEPKPGLVSDAHGGILFIDEIGEMDAILQNKLLKVLEDKRVFFESSYYDPQDSRIPEYIKHIFDKGVPADFVLIGATTRSREEISPALRSRCTEIFFEPLTGSDIRKIVTYSAGKLEINIEDNVPDIISEYAADGRTANKILVDAYSIALNQRDEVEGDSLLVTSQHIYTAIQNSRIYPSVLSKASAIDEIGRIFGMGASGYRGSLLEIEAIAFSGEKAEGRIRLNDTAGTMAKDSVFNAVSVLRKYADININDYDLHINFVGGGRVDGPSAGLAIYMVILSAIRSWNIKQNIAVTGEISIQGRIKPVGAIAEKVHGAKQAGIKKVIIPWDNVEDIPADLSGIEIIPVKSISETYPHIFAAMPSMEVK